MWIFTKYGFFSTVCARKGDGERGQPVDPGRIMIRARVREHLEELRKRFPDLSGQGEILKSAQTDYPFRVIVDKMLWSKVLSQLAEEINYGNFKSAVADHQGSAGAAYEDSLHKIWAITRTLQK